MAYFSNGSEGMVFDDQCTRCKYGRHACPIAFVQMDFNYSQHNDKSGTAQKILGHLVKPDGTCTMWETFKADFEIDPAQLELFEG
jgi:Fe-S-cluster-containing hydrogenase component 2